MENNTLKFLLNDKQVEIDFLKTDYLPSTTVLNYLRSQSDLSGTKEGCAEGDCGACTVVLVELLDHQLIYKTIDSCLLFLASVHGKQLITVEYLSQRKGQDIVLHPVQQAMINHHGSQCGFCTPGFVMSIFGMLKSETPVNDKSIIESLSGNLCRCTGYKPIVDAVQHDSYLKYDDHISAKEELVKSQLHGINHSSPSLKIHTSEQIYLLPSTLEEAISLKKNYPETRIINGATDTAIKQNKTHEYLPCILDVSNIKCLKKIDEIDGFFRLGSGVTIEQFKKFSEKHYKPFQKITDVFASLQIRNAATIGGNLSTSSPIGDLIPLFYAVKAKLQITGSKGDRVVNIEDFITGYRKNCLQNDELLVSILLPFLEDDIFVFSEKVSTRRDLDIATLSLAARLKLSSGNRIDEIILAFGGMAETVKRAEKAENFLLGKLWSQANVETAMAFIKQDFTPLSDARSGKEYRCAVSKNLLLKLFLSKGCILVNN